MSAEDPLGAVTSGFDTQGIDLVCPVHPMVARLDWGLGNMQAWSATLGSLPARPSTSWLWCT